MAFENKLLALAFGALIVLGFEVWFQNGCGPNRYFPSMFEVATKFPRQLFDSISPYFRGGNLIVLRLRCVIARQTLFSPSFWHENMAMEMPYFHFENLAEFCVWCAMVHRQGFASVYSPQMCHSTPNTRVHHTKCTITHTHAGIYIYI